MQQAFIICSDILLYDRFVQKRKTHMETKYVILLLFLVVAAFMDASSYKVRNWLTVSGLITGLIFCHSPEALLGMMLPFVIMMPLFASKLCGAGDIKLLMVLGLFAGPEGLLRCALPVLMAALLMALGMSRAKGEKLLKVRIPFAVPVLLGVMPFMIYGMNRL